MTYMLFAATEGAESSGILGFNLTSLIVQLITFILVFAILKRYAVKPIVALLEKRRKTIDDGVKLGLKLERERDKVAKEAATIKRDARHEADRIIANAHKEAREVVRNAEKSAQRKIDAMHTDAEARIKEEQERARRSLENELAGLVSEATEAVVGEKVDSKKDSEIIKKAMKGRNK